MLQECYGTFYTHAKTGRLKYLRKIQGWTILENIYWKYILKIYVRFKSSRRIIFFSSSHPLPFSISPLCIFVYSAPLLPASRLWSLSLEEQPTPSLIRPPTIHEVIGRCETLRETRRKTLCRGSSAVNDRACCLLDAWPFKSVADVHMCVCVCEWIRRCYYALGDSILVPIFFPLKYDERLERFEM